MQPSQPHPPELERQLAELPRMALPGLKVLWQEAFGRPAPPALHRDLLVRALAYRLQEIVYGGLKPAVRRQLLRLAEEVRLKGQTLAGPAKPRLKAGTRIVREWNGDTYVVTVHHEDFEFRGARYPSLSEIARQITGARWSGPRFFGLKTRAKGRSETSGVR